MTTSKWEAATTFYFGTPYHSREGDLNDYPRELIHQKTLHEVH